MAIKTYSKTSNTKLSNNFKVSEFACKGSGCCSTVKIDDKLVSYLQKIRDHFGASVTITSGYRCTTHNKKVGGTTGSKHASGMAADIKVKGVTPAEVAKYAESIGILGIGLYETDKDGHFVHIDTRTTKSFWYGQAQAKRSTFGGAPQTINKISVSLPTLRQGDDGKYVRMLQSLLNIEVDGNCGNETTSAIIAFQKKNGLTPDGIVGKRTWEKLLAN